MAANYGLLNNIATGLREGLVTYQTLSNMKNQQRQNDLLMQMQMKEKGYELTPSGELQQNLYGQGLDKLKQQQLAEELNLLNASSPKSKVYGQIFRESLKESFPTAAEGLDLSEGILSPKDYQSLLPIFKQDLATRLAMSNMAINQAKASSLSRPSAALTPGQKAADVAFGKSYSDWNAEGGRTTVEKNLGLLQDSINELKQPGEITGGLSTKIPGFKSDVAQSELNPQMLQVRDKARTAIQTSLRPILGAQFAAIEGEQIMNRAFDPKLNDEQNAQRLQAEFNAIQAMANDRDNAARYYEENGTLAGYKPATERSKGLISDSDSSEKVKVKDKQGKLYMLPKNQLKDALSQGYEEVK